MDLTSDSRAGRIALNGFDAGWPLQIMELVHV
jgi:hypothetical protein